jgi:hypothetical protein
MKHVAPIVIAGALLACECVVASQCSGTPPPAAAPAYAYGSKSCEVKQYVVNVVLPPPAPKTIPLKTIENKCPNCNSTNLTCSVQLGSSEAEAYQGTIAGSIGVSGLGAEVSFSHEVSYTSEASAGVTVEAPKCKTTIVGQTYAANVAYERTAKERFEYESCSFHRNDNPFVGTFLGSTTGPARSCGYENEVVKATATVVAESKTPQHKEWECPDPSCPSCCPEDKKHSRLPTPSIDRGRPAIVLPFASFSEGTLIGHVVGQDDRPIPNAAVSLGGDGSLKGVVQADEQGRFKLKIPAQQTTVTLAVAALGITAASRVLSGGEPELGTAPGEFVRPGELVSIAEDYSRARFEQGEVVLSTVVAQSTSQDGNDVISTYLVPRELTAGPVKVVLANRQGIEHNFRGIAYEIVAATLDREKLRAGQAASFSWRFSLGKEEAGKTLTVCAAVDGPVKVEGRSCGEVPIDQQGYGDFSGKIRALPAFTGTFWIRPIIGRSHGK